MKEGVEEGFPDFEQVVGCEGAGGSGEVGCERGEGGFASGAGGGDEGAEEGSKIEGAGGGCCHGALSYVGVAGWNCGGHAKGVDDLRKAVLWVKK